MSAHDLQVFLGGAIFMGEFVASLLFMSFWRRTGDRLFAWFAAAFAFLLLERVLLLIYTASHVNPGVYIARLVSFLLIIGAVIDRNRRGER